MDRLGYFIFCLILIITPSIIEIVEHAEPPVQQELGQQLTNVNYILVPVRVGARKRLLAR